jgi:hypothetical protein
MTLNPKPFGYEGLYLILKPTWFLFILFFKKLGYFSKLLLLYIA